MPRKSRVDELLAAAVETKVQQKSGDLSALVRVAYQIPREVAWGSEKTNCVGRTLEEDFAFQNLAWSQHADRRKLGLRIKNALALPLADLTEKLHLKISGSGFHKTDFALALIAQDESGWSVPLYIDEGLKWLAKQCVPAKSVAKPISPSAASTATVDEQTQALAIRKPVPLAK